MRLLLAMAVGLWGCAGRGPAQRSASPPRSTEPEPAGHDLAVAPPSPTQAPTESERVRTRLRALEAEVQALSGPAEGLSPDLAAHVPGLLAAMVAVDQHLRGALGAAVPEEWSEEERLAWLSEVDRLVRAADREHAGRVEALVARHGWFDRGRFGEAADQDGWILVQHADHDPDLQARMLVLIEDRVAAGQSSPARFAYLYDRVQAATGQPQRYGTQGRCTGPGLWEPLPLEAPDDVDRLRRDVGLGTLAAYRAEVGLVCRATPGEG